MKNRKRRHYAKRKALEKCGAWQAGRCPRCGGKSLFYFDRYDAVCCTACDTWTSAACDDPQCPFCAPRPASPSEAFYFEELRGAKEREREKKNWLRKNYAHKNDGKLRRVKRRAYFAGLRKREK